jgi:hypothetical protein
MIRKFLLVLSLLFISTFCLCQYPLNYFKMTSSNTSFPDTGRISGHLYNNILYSKQDHYSDSLVLIITPKNFNATKRADMIFWFHGWNNNIDSALVRYGLSRQFAASGLNAVLVLAETAKDAPDSYGGKLEQPGKFEGLVNDVLQTLRNEKVIGANCTAGHVILAGHSGAYRVMANIITDGNVPVDEVILFDALYADTDKFLNWLTGKSDRRFVDLYTDNGGTFDETKAMMEKLINLRVPVDSLEEPDVNPGILKKNRIVFIHTLHAHNDIIQQPDNFELFIDNIPFLKKIN